MKRILAAISFCLFSVSAHAGVTQAPDTTYPLGTLLSSVALNAAAATRTATITLSAEKQGYGLLVLSTDHSNSSGALDIIVTCYQDLAAAGGTDSVLQSCTVASGVCTSDDASWKKSVTGDKEWPWRIDIKGLVGQINCVYSASGAGASDLVSVVGYLVTN